MDDQPVTLWTMRREGEEIAWFAPEAIAGLAMPPLDYPLAEALLATLRQKSR